MRISGILLGVITALCFQGCTTINKLISGKPVLTATIVREGLINCFDKGLTLDGKPVWCEASAIVYTGKKLYVANDKDMPGNLSSVFTMPFLNGFFDGFQHAEYSTSPLLKKAKKFEDFALSPDGKYVFLTTGFDRVQPSNKSWDGYNTVVYWKAGEEDKPHVLSANGSDTTSVSYREKISRALASSDFPKGPPYFKIEGLAATADMLYWGIREEGKRYDSFTYKIKILTTPYTLLNDKVVLGDFKLLTEIKISKVNPGNHPMALSSIEYDPYLQRFLLLTSYEEKDSMGGYLWMATPEELQAGIINPVKDAQGTPVVFHNKCEDLAIISKGRLIVIHDDDRMQPVVEGETRQPHQAAYSVVEFK